MTTHMNIQLEEVTLKVPESSFEVERACQQFLFREAELLDDNKYLEWWTTCLSVDLDYLVPTRATRERNTGVSEFSNESFHMKDTKGSMKVRVSRLLTEHAWAEDPASRTSRLVTNVRVNEISPEEAEVKNSLALYRSQWDTTEFDLIVGHRYDVLRVEDGEWRLAKRLVHLAHTSLGTPNLGVFL